MRSRLGGGHIPLCVATPHAVLAAGRSHLHGIGCLGGLEDDFPPILWRINYGEFFLDGMLDGEVFLDGILDRSVGLGQPKIKSLLPPKVLVVVNLVYLKGILNLFICDIAEDDKWNPLRWRV
jgi:hypothetical protein